VPGSPVTGTQLRTAGPCGYLHVDPRQEPGAVVPHAGICAGVLGNWHPTATNIGAYSWPKTVFWCIVRIGYG
jgi:hypothetical protein